jgi:hypothetical protein
MIETYACCWLEVRHDCCWLEVSMRVVQYV